MGRVDRSRPRVFTLVCSVVVAVLAWAEVGQAQADERLHVPDGFVVEAYAEGLAGPRGMAFGPDGGLYVALTSEGRVVRLADSDGDGRAEEVATAIADLDRPVAIAWSGDGLWVAEMGRVIFVPDPGGDSAFEYKVIVDSLPSDGPLSRALLVEPSGGAFYISIAASCDHCREDDPRRASILRFSARGDVHEIWARGLRSTTGLAFHPETGELWATDSGRGGLGDRLPPDELNVIRRGSHYGWPYCYGHRVASPEFANPQRCDVTSPPVLSFPAHSAPQGISFYTGDTFPAEYRGDAFVALAGSAETGPLTSGVKVVRLRVVGGRPVGFQDFLTGWTEAGGIVWGQPVVPLVGPDGALYVSDVVGGRIWRVSYRGVGERPVGAGP